MGNDIKLNYMLVCDQVLIDQKGKGSFIGVFEKIQATSTPAVHSQFSVAVSTIGSPNTSCIQKIEIINLSDNNKMIAFVEKKLEFKETGIANFVGSFINILFPVFGKYWIKVSVDGESITDSEKHYVLVEKI
ncbi:MAG: hypothetical protein WC264_02115 [Candidatus Paceibacterota bacterium]|jgi:hypothetical protein